MKILAFQILSLLLISLFASHTWGEEKSDSMVSGAFIVVEKENPISFLNASGEPMDKKVEVGSVLEPEEWALSWKGGKLSLLLSNGTLVTLLPNTKMKLGDFNQIPFEPGDLKVSDLKEEPSSSRVSLDLDFGALVVKTKMEPRAFEEPSFKSDHNQNQACNWMLPSPPLNLLLQEEVQLQ